MKESEKKKIVKRHYDNLRKAEELEEKYFMRKVKQRGRALKEWKDKM